MVDKIMSDKLKIQILVGVFFLISAGISSAAFAADYIVKIKPRLSFAKTTTLLSKIPGIHVESTHQRGNLLKLSVSSHGYAEQAHQIVALLKNPNVEYVVENVKMHAFGAPNDPSFASQWALAKINAAAAWDISMGLKDIIVAVIDTGADYNHEDLKYNMWVNPKEIPGNGIDDDGNGFIDDVHGWDFFGNDNDPMDKTSSGNPGHGTHCSGIIGAVGNNNIGVSGINQTISIMPLRFIGEDGTGDLYDSVKAIDYAIDNGAKVMSASWGAEIPRGVARPIIEAIGRAREKGIIFVAAAGHGGTSNDQSPVYPANAALDNVISVAASDSDDVIPLWSNYGRLTVDLASPGLDILSTLPNDTYGTLSGTSMATPLVAGMVALELSIDDKINPIEAKALLQSYGSKVDIETACACRIDANATMLAIANHSLTVAPAAGHMDIGETIQLGAYGGKGPYSFTSHDDTVASISDKGVLTGVKAGSTIVTVKDQNGATSDSLSFIVGTT